MDEDEWDEASEWDDLDKRAEQPGNTGDASTPGERLLYTLGQLFLLWHRGELDVAPRDFDVEDLARIIGVARDIEFTSDGPLGRSFHMPGEALVLDRAAEFPWRLLSDEAWAASEEAAELDLGI